MELAVASPVTMMTGTVRQDMDDRRIRRVSVSPFSVSPRRSVKTTPGSTSRSSSKVRSSSLSMKTSREPMPFMMSISSRADAGFGSAITILRIDGAIRFSVLGSAANKRDSVATVRSR